MTFQSKTLYWGRGRGLVEKMFRSQQFSIVFILGPKSVGMSLYFIKKSREQDGQTKRRTSGIIKCASIEVTHPHKYNMPFYRKHITHDKMLKTKEQKMQHLYELMYVC